MKTQRLNSKDLAGALKGFLLQSEPEDDYFTTLLTTVSILEKMESHLVLKKCTRCLNWKPSTHEYFDTYTPAADGLAYQCKKCRARRVKEWKSEKEKNIANTYSGEDQEAITLFRKQNNQNSKKEDEFEEQAQALERMATGEII